MTTLIPKVDLKNGGATPAGAVNRPINLKLYDSVSVKDFGAVGDYTTDDTASVHAAMDYAIDKGVALYFPNGIYRVTSGYTNNTLYQTLVMYGEGAAEDATSVTTISSYRGSWVCLDNVSSSSYFYNSAQSNSLQVSNLNFVCNQEVLDRQFFIFSGMAGAAHWHTFQNVTFRWVEQPFVYTNTSYFQSANYTNINFYNSGTFHSKADSTTLIGTLMMLVNVHHEDIFLENSEKICCNLTGIRHITADNFLLEGAISSSGWVCALRLGWDYSPVNYRRDSIGEFTNLWIEISYPNFPVNSIYQSGGQAVYKNLAYGFLDGQPGLLIDYAGYAVFENCALTDLGTSNNYQLVGKYTRLEFNDSTGGTLNLTSPQVTLNNVLSSDVSLYNQTKVSTTASTTLFNYNGGYIPNLTATIGTAFPSTDADYIRKYAFQPDGTGGFNSYFYLATTPTSLTAYPAVYTYWLAGILRTPATGSLFRINIHAIINGVDIIVFQASYAGNQYLSGLIPFTFPFNLDVGATKLYVEILGQGITAGQSTEILSLQMGMGENIPKEVRVLNQPNIITYNTAAPTVGGWTIGDIVYNSAPAVGQPTGWVCTATGTPGTWNAMANL